MFIRQLFISASGDAEYQAHVLVADNPSLKDQFFNSYFRSFRAHLQSSVFKLSKDLIDSIHEEGIVAYTS